WQYTRKLATRRRHDAMDAGTLRRGGGRRGTAGKPAPGGAEVLLAAATGEGRSRDKRRSEDLHRRGAQGRAGLARAVGLRRRGPRAAGPRQRSHGAGGGAQEAEPARVRRDGADRKVKARGEGSQARRPEQAAGGRV